MSPTDQSTNGSTEVFEIEDKDFYMVGAVIGAALCIATRLFLSAKKKLKAVEDKL